MTNVLDVTGPAATLLLALPLAALALLVARAARPRANPARSLPGSLSPDVRRLHGQRAEQGQLADKAAPDPVPGYAILGRSPEPPRLRETEITNEARPNAIEPLTEMQEPEAIEPAVPLRDSAGEAPSEHRLADEVRAAEAANDQARLAALYLAAALGDLDAGHTPQAAENLRKSIRSAVKTRNAPVHARARIELAELARASGDLTTACEHWQIARALFSEMRDGEALEGAEALMQRHGCPTDWVLNDF